MGREPLPEELVRDCVALGGLLRQAIAAALAPLGVTQVRLAEHIGVSVQRINEIIRGKRGVTPETAWLLAQAFGTTPQFWVNLQSNYDLASVRPKRSVSKLRKAG